MSQESRHQQQPHGPGYPMDKMQHIYALPAVAAPVLGHRILRNYAAISDGVNTDQLVEELLKNVGEPNYR